MLQNAVISEEHMHACCSSRLPKSICQVQGDMPVATGVKAVADGDSVLTPFNKGVNLRLFHVMPCTLGCGAKCDSSDILALQTGRHQTTALSCQESFRLLHNVWSGQIVAGSFSPFALLGRTDKLLATECYIRSSRHSATNGTSLLSCPTVIMNKAPTCTATRQPARLRYRAFRYFISLLM